MQNTNSVSYRWYKAVASKKKWNEFYSKLPTHYTLLGKGSDKDEISVGFLAVIPPEGCLEITNQEELNLIKTNLESNNTYPRTN